MSRLEMRSEGTILFPQSNSDLCSLSFFSCNSFIFSARCLERSSLDLENVLAFQTFLTLYAVRAAIHECPCKIQQCKCAVLFKVTEENSSKQCPIASSNKIQWHDCEKCAIFKKDLYNEWCTHDSLNKKKLKIIHVHTFVQQNTY